MMTAQEARKESMTQIEANTVRAIVDIENTIENAISWGMTYADYELKRPVNFEQIRRYLEELGYEVYCNKSNEVEVVW